jgi:hypothetical protein
MTTDRMSALLAEMSRGDDRRHEEYYRALDDRFAAQQRCEEDLDVLVERVMSPPPDFRLDLRYQRRPSISDRWRLACARGDAWGALRVDERWWGTLTTPYEHYLRADAELCRRMRGSAAWRGQPRWARRAVRDVLLAHVAHCVQAIDHRRVPPGEVGRDVIRTLMWNAPVWLTPPGSGSTPSISRRGPGSTSTSPSHERKSQ